eukprot:TCONS_00064235-protein
MMKTLLVFCCIALLFGQAFSLDVVQNKTGAQQVKEALSKAEKESNLASKTTLIQPSSRTQSTKDESKAHFIRPASAKDLPSNEDKIDKIIDAKMAQLEKLRKRHKAEKAASSKLNKKVKNEDNDNDNTENLTASLKKTESVEKENSKLEEASDKKMATMAKKLTSLVQKFQNRIGHIAKIEKKIENGGRDVDEDDESTKKIARGKPSHMPTSLGGLDVTALNADDSNGKASYKEDVKLEDKLALEAEEEKKVTNTENYDDDSASEAAAGVDKSNVDASTTSSSLSTSLSPKDQASQEMQNYNALISSESNRELTQIQDEINKATTSSMGKVSVVGQQQNVQAESQSPPALPGLGGAENIEGNGPTGALEGLLNGGTPGAGGDTSDPLAAALAAGNQAGGEMGATGGNDATLQQATSINDLTGEVGQQQQQQPGGSDVASLNIGGGGSNGQSPIEVGSSTPVDMGMFGANNQQGTQGAEQGAGSEGGIPQEMQSRLTEQQQPSGEQQSSDGQGMSYKKNKINRFAKQKNYKRTVAKRPPKGR